jgi:hypothetical protein
MSQTREKRIPLLIEYKEMKNQYENVKELKHALSIKMANIPYIISGAVCASSFLHGSYQAFLLDLRRNQRLSSDQWFLEIRTDYSQIGLAGLVACASLLLCLKSYHNGLEFQRRRIQDLNQNELIQKLVALAPDMGLSVENVLNSSLTQIYPHLENLEKRLCTKITNNENNRLGEQFLKASVQLNNKGLEIFGIFKYDGTIRTKYPVVLTPLLEYLGAYDIANKFKKR